MQGYIGVVTCFAGDFIPKSWLPCNGQQLQINIYSAVYAILGTQFGGDGQTYFSLPDLRGRTPVSPGSNGNSDYNQGAMAGTEMTTLIVSQMPAHTHDGSQALAGMQANSSDGIDPNPSSGFPSRFTGAYSPTPTPDCFMPKAASYPYVQNVGGSQPVPILSPYLAINYMICLEGIFPSRG